MSGWSVASNVTFEARGIGTSEAVRGKKRVWYGSRLETILFWPFLGLGCAPMGGPTIEPLSVAELAGLAEVAFADATAVPIETLVAAAGAEGAVLILNRFGEPRTATRIAAIVLSLVRRRACGRCCGRTGRAICAVLALASLSTSLGATAGKGSGAHNICAEHGSCTRLLAALTGLIQHRLKRPHGHPQKPADPDRRDVAARSGVIGPIAAQSEIFLPGRGDTHRKRSFFAHKAFLLIQVSRCIFAPIPGDSFVPLICQ